MSQHCDGYLRAARFQAAAGKLVIKMTPASSVFFFEPKFNNFLHAPIGVEKNQMALSVLSALARLDIDPWTEAAELSALSQSFAAQRLSSLLMRLPDGRWTQADVGVLAVRLVQLLPHPNASNVRLFEAQNLGGGLLSVVVQFMIILVFAVSLLISTKFPIKLEGSSETSRPAPATSHDLSLHARIPAN